MFSLCLDLCSTATDDVTCRVRQNILVTLESAIHLEVFQTLYDYTLHLFSLSFRNALSEVLGGIA